MGFFRLLARVLEAPTLYLVEGSLEDSTARSRADIGMVGIDMSPSNLGIGDMKLSKSCIQEVGI
jgi:hypothetical protein